MNNIVVLNDCFLSDCADAISDNLKLISDEEFKKEIAYKIFNDNKFNIPIIEESPIYISKSNNKSINVFTIIASKEFIEFLLTKIKNVNYYTSADGHILICEKTKDDKNIFITTENGEELTICIWDEYSFKKYL